MSGPLPRPTSARRPPRTGEAAVALSRLAAASRAGLAALVVSAVAAGGWWQLRDPAPAAPAALAADAVDHATAAGTATVDAAPQTSGDASRDAAAAGVAERRREAVAVVGAAWLLLGLFWYGIVAPSLRTLRSAAERAEGQAAENARLALVAERTRNLVLITDRDDRVLWANEAFERMSGFTAAQIVGRRPGEVLHHPAADPATLQRLRAALQRGEPLRIELLNHMRDGRDLWLDIDIQPWHDADGTVAGFVSVSSDITAQVQDRQRLRALLAALPAGVVVHAPDGSIVDANRGAEQMLGLEREQLLARTATDPRWAVLDENGDPCADADLPAMRTAASGRGVRGQTVGVQLPDGRQRWLLVNTEPVFDVQGRLETVLTCFVDVTEQRRLQDELRATARTDALTGLPNRAVVLERVGRALQHARAHAGYGFALLFMDFDRFKDVNDTLGHAAGDELLRQIAGRLEAALRPGDALARVGSEMGSEMHTAARMGGDEFVVLLERTRGGTDAMAVAERLLARLAQPYLIGGQSVQSGVSIGVVSSDQAGGDADSVLRDADTAMYEAKRAGRGRCVLFDRSMRDRLVHAMALATDLRAALRDGQLFVVYQPVVELGQGRLDGVEALARWRHPARGLVPPAEFIAIAEETGLIGELGDFVLRTACSDFAHWRATLGARAPRRIAVNLSRRQLDDDGFVDGVRDLLAQLGLPPPMLQLEITESLAAQGAEAVLRALKALGVQLSLDDFGTGYSSLACLHQLPVDRVKIDRSFVAHAETVEYHRVLIEATTRVARTLGMHTVAEGIETPGQARLMAALGCDGGQGWLFGRPLPAGELLAAMASTDREPLALG